jgi:hypothetical protein
MCFDVNEAATMEVFGCKLKSPVPKNDDNTGEFVLQKFQL